MKKLELLLKWQTADVGVKPRSLTKKRLKTRVPVLLRWYKPILPADYKNFGQNTKYLRMQESIQNKVTCGGNLKPREATHAVGVSWYGFAPGKAPVVEHLSSSQTAKTSKQTVSP